MHCSYVCFSVHLESDANAFIDFALLSVDKYARQLRNRLGYEKVTKMMQVNLALPGFSLHCIALHCIALLCFAVLIDVLQCPATNTAFAVSKQHLLLQTMLATLM